MLSPKKSRKNIPFIKAYKIKILTVNFYGLVGPGGPHEFVAHEPPLK